MTILTGGLRERLIHSNLEDMIRDSLTALGWFNSGRAHAPVHFVGFPMDRESEIPPNTIALSDENIDEQQWEQGSRLAQHSWVYYLDIYAENPSLGIHLRGDLEAILNGRLNSIGRLHPTFNVYDVRQATPPFLFYCEIEEVVRDKGQEWSGTKPWMKFWYMLRFKVNDYYRQDSDPTDTLDGVGQ